MKGLLPTSIARVLMIAPTPFFGDRGCHVRIYEETRNLQHRGIDVEVATYPTGRDVPDVPIRRARSLPGLRPRPLGPSYGRPLLDASLLATALRAARRFKPQILHAHLHEGIAIGVVLRRLTGAPLVADLQGGLAAELADHQFLDGNGPTARVVGRLERWLVRQADAIFVSSAAAPPMLVEQGVDAGRIVSLPDGADLQHFRPLPPDEPLVERLGLRGKQVIVFLGVLTPYQGVDVLIDAIPAVVRACPDAHFLIMGYPNLERYRAMVAARGVEPWTTLPGQIPYPDAARWLSLGSVAVSPKTSLTEANGKLLNYMACGLPVVATDTLVNREILGDAGVYVPVGDVETLASRLVDLLQAPERRRRLGETLRHRVEAEFEWTTLTDRMLAVYRRVAASRSAPA